MKVLPLLLHAVGLLATAAVTSQQPQGLPRGDTKLNANYLPVVAMNNIPAQGWNNWRVAAPTQRLGATLPGTYPTAQVAYACYMDVDANATPMVPVMAFRRSIDGGLTWGAAQTVFPLLPGEVLASSWTRLVCDEHRVYLVVALNRGTSAASNRAVYVVGSHDQGQTWSQPILASTGIQNATDPLLDCEEPQAVAANGYLHVVYRADRTTSSNEDLYYASFTFVGTTLSPFAPETRVNNGYPLGAADVDFGSIDAYANFVHVAWQDDRIRPPADGLNNTYSRVSATNGLDLSSVTEIAHSNNAVASTFAVPRRSIALLSGPNADVLMEDSNTDPVDVVKLRFSNDFGQTWQGPVRVNATPNGVDIDGFLAAADGSTLMVAYRDDRNGTGNANNSVFVVTDAQAGMGFLAGPRPEFALSSIDSVLYSIDLKGSVGVVGWEQCVFPEEWALAITSDGGASWHASTQVTSRGSCSTPPGIADVDDLTVAVTANGDVLGIWLDDRDGGGNNTNNVYATGTRVPEIHNRLAQNQGFAFSKFPPSEVGNPVALLISASGTTPPFALDPLGLTVQLALDQFTLAGLSIPGVFLTQVGANREAALPSVPNLPTLLGIPFHGAGLTFDLATGRFSAFTDPIRF